MPLFALVVWPFIAIILFVSLPRIKALILAIIVSHLILPEKYSINIQGLPGIDKNVIMMLGVFLGLMLVKDAAGNRRDPQKAAPKLLNTKPFVGVLVFGLLGLMIVGGIMTIATNQDPLSFGTTFLPGQRPWDLISLVFENLIILAPFFLGRRYLATPEAHRTLLIFMVVAGLYYSLLALVELRLSPQLHNWIYGYYQHSFLQHIRGGGFRPMIFLPHGLWVGFFFCSTVIGAFCLFRSRIDQAGKWGIAAVWLLLILLASRNLGASAIAFMMIVVIWLPRVLQLRVIYAIAVVFLLFPAVRQYVVPLDRIVTATAAISEDRAQSFEFRLRNEEQLLDRAGERPMFGWGQWGRSRVYDESGRDLTVTDGIWVIVLGVGGWAYYVSYLGLLALPTLLLPKVKRRKEIPIETIGLGLIVAANLIYLIPNSSLGPIEWLIAGALAGFVQFDKKKVKDDATVVVENDARESKYSRFAPGARA